VDPTRFIKRLVDKEGYTAGNEFQREHFVCLRRIGAVASRDIENWRSGEIDRTQVYHREEII
jgi:hypothetical protein